MQSVHTVKVFSVTKEEDTHFFSILRRWDVACFGGLGQLKNNKDSFWAETLSSYQVWPKNCLMYSSKATMRQESISYPFPCNSRESDGSVWIQERSWTPED